MSRKSHKNKLHIEGEKFDFFTVKKDDGTLHCGFVKSGKKHITIIHERDGISSHLTEPRSRKRLKKVSHEKVKEVLSFKDLKIINVESSWELWHPKEDIVSITFEYVAKGKLPKAFIDAGKNHFDSLIQLTVGCKCLNILFKQISYEQILNEDYNYAYKIDENGIISRISNYTKTDAIELPLFSKETENMLRSFLSPKDLMQDSD